MKLWQIVAQIVTNRITGSTSVGVPRFFLLAQDADHAISQASLILMCDRRTEDGILVEVHGTVAVAKMTDGAYGSVYGMIDVDGEGYASFSNRMVRT